MIALEEMTQVYAGQRVLGPVNLVLEAGERVALVGASGEGKSTLARLLLGLERPASGRLMFDGSVLDRRARPVMRTFRRQVQGVFQDAPGAVNPRHRVERIIGEPLEHLTSLDRSARQARVMAMLAAVQLPTELASRLPHQLSGGQLQRVCLARALAIEPALLVCDEVTSGLDTILQVALGDWLLAHCRQQRMGLVFVTHDLRLARRLCDRLVVIERGVIVDDVRAHQSFTHPAAMALEAAVLT
ncbi:ATP-binding cassette domain-containing protein [Salinicola sp. CR57]|uniref:ATP-binding cassette domain-containing protein n=1 Tax=Salinicola sp. CR57 TaxID=1949086 RepID=UPI000DA13585|nr:ATP-binding cassette domain-containing protein [Salinicola sp. CR57]